MSLFIVSPPILLAVIRFPFAAFRTADDEFASKKLFVVQFDDGAFCFVHSSHYNETESLRFLVVLVSDNLGVLHRADAAEELEQIAFRRFKRQIADVDFR
jgi:hypothetical protein